MANIVLCSFFRIFVFLLSHQSPSSILKGETLCSDNYDIQLTGQSWLVDNMSVYEVADKMGWYQHISQAL